MINLKETTDGATNALLKGRLAILATILASRGCDLAKQTELLDRVVAALQNAELRDTLVNQKGQPIAVDLVTGTDKDRDTPIFVFNQTLLSSVSGLSVEMLSEQLAKPIAKLLDLPAATITIVFHDKGDDQIRDLSFKLLGQTDQEVVPNNALPQVQRFLVKRFSKRLFDLIADITSKSKRDAQEIGDEGLEELLSHIGRGSRWPHWADVVKQFVAAKEEEKNGNSESTESKESKEEESETLSDSARTLKLESLLKPLPFRPIKRKDGSISKTGQSDSEDDQFADSDNNQSTEKLSDSSDAKDSSSDSDSASSSDDNRPKTPPKLPPLPIPSADKENDKSEDGKNDAPKDDKKNDKSEDKPDYGVFLNKIIAQVDEDLQGSDWEGQGAVFANILWNSIDLNPYSVLLDAGREVRSRGLASPDKILQAIAGSLLKSEVDFSIELKEWPRLTELSAAIDKLTHEEGLLFGSASFGKSSSHQISVVEVASQALGTVMPVDLPFDIPLICWTSREIDALRDAYLGKYKGLHGAYARNSAFRTFDFSNNELKITPLAPGFEEDAPAIKIIPIGSNEVPNVVDAHAAGESFQGNDANSLVERAWFSNLKQSRYQFAGVPDAHAVPLLEDMIAVYEAIDLDIQEVWGRRIKDRVQMQKHPAAAFKILTQAFAEMTGKPILLDPFQDLESSVRKEVPRFVVISPVVTKKRVAVCWIPLKLLSATKVIGPITVRLVEEIPAKDDEPLKLKARYDISLHVDQLNGQPADVLFQSIYGDSIQLVSILQ